MRRSNIILDAYNELRERGLADDATLMTNPLAQLRRQIKEEQKQDLFLYDPSTIEFQEAEEALLALNMDASLGELVAEEQEDGVAAAAADIHQARKAKQEELLLRRDQLKKHQEHKKRQRKRRQQQALQRKASLPAFEKSDGLSSVGDVGTSGGYASSQQKGRKQHQQSNQEGSSPLNAGAKQEQHQQQQGMPLAEWAYQDHSGIDADRNCIGNRRLFASHMAERYGALRSHLFELLHEKVATSASSGASAPQHQQQQEDTNSGSSKKKNTGPGLRFSSQVKVDQMSDVMAGEMMMDESEGLPSQQDDNDDENLVTVAAGMATSQILTICRSDSLSKATFTIIAAGNNSHGSSSSTSIQGGPNRVLSSSFSSSAGRRIASEESTTAPHQQQALRRTTSQQLQQQQQPAPSSSFSESPSKRATRTQSPSRLQSHVSQLHHQPNQKSPVVPGPSPSFSRSVPPAMNTRDLNNSAFNGSSTGAALTASGAAAALHPHLQSPPPTVSAIMQKVVLPPLSMEQQHGMDKEAERARRRRHNQLVIIFDRCVVWGMKCGVLSLEEENALREKRENVSMQAALIDLHDQLKAIKKQYQQYQQQQLQQYLHLSKLSSVNGNTRGGDDDENDNNNDNNNTNDNGGSGQLSTEAKMKVNRDREAAHMYRNLHAALVALGMVQPDPPELVSRPAHVEQRLRAMSALGRVPSRQTSGAMSSVSNLVATIHQPNAESLLAHERGELPSVSIPGGDASGLQSSSNNSSNNNTTTELHLQQQQSAAEARSAHERSVKMSTLFHKIATGSGRDVLRSSITRGGLFAPSQPASPSSFAAGGGGGAAASATLRNSLLVSPASMNRRASRWNAGESMSSVMMMGPKRSPPTTPPALQTPQQKKTTEALELLRKRLEEQEKQKQFEDVLRIYGSPLEHKLAAVTGGASSTNRGRRWKVTGRPTGLYEGSGLPSLSASAAASFSASSKSRSGRRSHRRPPGSSSRRRGSNRDSPSSSSSPSRSGSAGSSRRRGGAGGGHGASRNDSHSNNLHGGGGAGGGHGASRNDSHSNNLHGGGSGSSSRTFIPTVLREEAKSKLAHDEENLRENREGGIRWFFATQNDPQRILRHQRDSVNNNNSNVPLTAPVTSVAEIISNLAPYARVVEVTFLDPNKAALSTFSGSDEGPAVATTFSLRHLKPADVAKRLAQADNVVGARGYVTVIPHDETSRALLQSELNKDAASSLMARSAAAAEASTPPQHHLQHQNSSNALPSGRKSSTVAFLDNHAASNSINFLQNFRVSCASIDSGDVHAQQQQQMHQQFHQHDDASSSTPNSLDTSGALPSIISSHNNINNPPSPSGSGSGGVHRLVPVPVSQINPKATPAQRKLPHLLGPLRFGGKIVFAAPQDVADQVGTVEFLRDNFSLPSETAQKIVNETVAAKLFPQNEPKASAALAEKSMETRPAASVSPLNHSNLASHSVAAAAAAASLPSSSSSTAVKVVAASSAVVAAAQHQRTPAGATSSSSSTPSSPSLPKPPHHHHHHHHHHHSPPHQNLASPRSSTSSASAPVVVVVRGGPAPNPNMVYAPEFINSGFARGHESSTDSSPDQSTVPSASSSSQRRRPKQQDGGGDANNGGDGNGETFADRFGSGLLVDRGWHSESPPVVDKTPAPPSGTILKFLDGQPTSFDHRAGSPSSFRLHIGSQVSLQSGLVAHAKRLSAASIVDSEAGRSSRNSINEASDHYSNRNASITPSQDGSAHDDVPMATTVTGVFRPAPTQQQQQQQQQQQLPRQQLPPRQRRATLQGSGSDMSEDYKQVTGTVVMPTTKTTTTTTTASTATTTASTATTTAGSEPRLRQHQQKQEQAAASARYSKPDQSSRRREQQQQHQQQQQRQERQQPHINKHISVPTFTERQKEHMQRHIKRHVHHENSLALMPVNNRVYRVVCELPYAVGPDELNPFFMPDDDDDGGGDGGGIDHRHPRYHGPLSRSDRVLNEAEEETVSKVCQRRHIRGERCVAGKGAVGSFLAKHALQRSRFGKQADIVEEAEQEMLMSQMQEEEERPDRFSETFIEQQQRFLANGCSSNNNNDCGDGDGGIPPPTTVAFFPPSVRLPRPPSEAKPSLLPPPGQAAKGNTDDVVPNPETAVLPATARLAREELRFIMRKQQMLQALDPEQQQQPSKPIVTRQKPLAITAPPAPSLFEGAKGTAMETAPRQISPPIREVYRWKAGAKTARCAALPAVSADGGCGRRDALRQEKKPVPPVELGIATRGIKNEVARHNGFGIAGSAGIAGF